MIQPYTADLTLHQCKKRSVDESRETSGSIQLANQHLFWLYVQESAAVPRQHLVTECQLHILMSIRALSQTYERNGYIGGVPMLSRESAAQHRALMKAAAEQIGSLH